jgi:hypothetical protein
MSDGLSWLAVLSNPPAFPAFVSSSDGRRPTAAPTALATFDSALEGRHLDVIRIARHVDQRLVAAGISCDRTQ